MAPVVIPNTVQVRLIWQLNNVDYAVNVLHFRNPNATPVDPTMAAGFATDVNNAWSTSGIAADIANDVRISQVTVRDLNVANQPEFPANVASAVGTSNSDVLPLGNTMVVTLRTNLAGKSFRGRVYLPGWAEVANGTQGQIVAASMGRGEGFIINLRAQAAARQLILGVASRKLAQINDTATLGILTRDNRWDTQRRRAVPGI